MLYIITGTAPLSPCGRRPLPGPFINAVTLVFFRARYCQYSGKAMNQRSHGNRQFRIWTETGTPGIDQWTVNKSDIAIVVTPACPTTIAGIEYVTGDICRPVLELTLETVYWPRICCTEQRAITQRNGWVTSRAAQPLSLSPQYRH